MKKYITILLILLSLSSYSKDTTFTQKGDKLYITTRRGTALVRNQDLYERKFNYNLESEKREKRVIIILDAVLLSTFFVVRALMNKN